MAQPKELPNQTVVYDEKERIWHGPTSNLSEFFGSVGQYLLQGLRSLAHDTVIQINYNDGIQLAANDTAKMSIRLVQYIRQFSLKQTDIIGIVARNTTYLTPVILATIFDSIPCNPVAVEFTKDEIKHLFNTTRPKLIFCDEDVYEKVKWVSDELSLSAEIVIIDGKLGSARTAKDIATTPTGTEDDFVPAVLEQDQDQIAVVLSTSGTTGLPKGISLSHKLILRRMLLDPNFRMQLVGNPKIYSSNSISWISGYRTLLQSVCFGAARLIHATPFNTTDFFKMVKEYKVNHFVLMPNNLIPVIQELENGSHDISSVLAVMTGAAYMPIEYINRLRKIIGRRLFANFYGMTEFGGTCSASIENFEDKCVGRLSTNIDVKIVDRNGKNVGIGETGEICVHNGCKWNGYYKNPQATSEVYKDGWIHTGDLGYINEKYNLYLVGRKMDMVQYNDHNFNGSEVEKVIREIPDVIDVSVIGIPNEATGDLPAAAVVKAEDSVLSQDDIYEYVHERVPDYKNLRGGVYFVSSIPKTPSGKIRKYDVKQLVAKQRAQNSVNEQEKEITKRKFKGKCCTSS